MSEVGVARLQAARRAAERRRLLLRAWPAATVRALGALACVAGLGVLMAFLLRAGGLLLGTSVADTAREGGVLFYLFHHVGIEVAMPRLVLPMHAEVVAGLPSGYSIDGTFAFALMGGTLVAGWLLYRAGRAVASSGGGGPVERGVHGAKVAVPYALVSWAAAWGLTFHPPFPHTPPTSVHPSHVASLFWPLAIGLVAGCAGGVRSAGGAGWTSDWWAGEDWNRRWRGALGGGWAMLVAAFGLATVALLGLALARPGDAAAYFRTVFSGSAVGGIALIAMTLLELPNLAAWLLVPSVGGCLQVSGSTLYSSYCFVGYGSFPGHPLGGPPNPSGFPNLGSAPPAFYLFGLVPLVAVLVGGIWAARRAAARSRPEGMVVGMLAGLVFAVAFFAAMVLASITVRLNGPIFIVSSGYWRYGPPPASGFQLGLLWGLIGGGIGGVVGARWPGGRLRAAAAAPPPAGPIASPPS